VHLKKDYQYIVEKINKRNGKLTLRNRDFHTTISPSKVEDINIFFEKELSLSIGDKIQLTKNSFGRNNRETFRVSEINESKIVLGNNEIYLDRRDAHHIDHAIVQSTYGSQGQTANRVLLLAEASVSKKTWYVAISRAKRVVEVVTDNVIKLKERIQKSQKKLNVYDVSSPTVINHRTKRDKGFEVEL
jgi:hypothetical protein